MFYIFNEKFCIKLHSAFLNIRYSEIFIMYRSLILFLILPSLVIAVPDFEITELNTGNAIEQTIVTAFLADEDRADLIVISVSEEFEKTLELYELQNNGYASEPLVYIPLEDDVISIDVGRLQQRDILVMFTDHEAFQYDPRTGTKKTLIQYNSIYNTPIRDSVPNLDLFRDLNKDDLDDFFIPGFTGFTGYMQMEDGSFSDGIAMYAPPVMNMSSGSASYRATQNYLTDMNLDGIQDIVFWVNDHLSVFAGRPDGLFESKAIKFDSAVPYQYGSMVDMERAMSEDQSDFNAKVLFRLTDLDNDEITDLIVMSITSESVLKKNTTYEIYKGFNSDSGQLVFSDVPVSKIVLKGLQIGLQEMDFNDDEKIDFLAASVELGLGKIIKALFSGTANIDLNFYQMEGDRYPEKPNVTRKLTIKFDLFSGKVFVPTILNADLDGDGFSELIVQKGSDTLQIYTGIDDEKLFEKKPVNINVDLPEGQNGGGIFGGQNIVKLVDLNNDDKLDILIRHESKIEPNRIIVMLSK